MKYGNQLASRSIPEWSYYNVNYNAIKQVIKDHTLVKPIPIPSRPCSSSQLAQSESDPDPQFTALFYNCLSEEYNRAELFVQSKITELDARLTALSRRVTALTTRYKPAPRPSIPFRLLERLSLLEGEILEAGVLLRKLSRFVGAQRTAFVKLLKKYIRWHGNAFMAVQFRQTHLDRSDDKRYLAIGSLDPHFEWWLAVLSDLRSLVLSKDGNDGTLESASHNSRSALPITAIDRESLFCPLPRPLLLPMMDPEDVHSEPNSAKPFPVQQPANRESLGDILAFDLTFDTALSVTDPPGCAVYWVHPDNLIELQVLLNNHFSTLSPSPHGSVRPAHTRVNSRTSVESSSLKGLSRKPSLFSLHGSGICRDQNFQWTTSLAVDDPNRISSESLVSVAGIARRTGQGDVLFTLRQVPKNRRESFPATPICSRVKEKFFPCLLDPSARFLLPSPSTLTSNSREASSFDQQVDDLNAIRRFMEKNKTFSPLVCCRSRRTRYVGLHNMDGSSLFACLDQSILLGDARKWLHGGTGDEFPDMGNMPVSTFPYAVFTVKMEGGSSTGGTNESIRKLLDESPLAYRVDGFTILTHGIWKYCSPPGLGTPPWVLQIETDIRARANHSDSDLTLGSPLGTIKDRTKRHGRSAAPSSALLSRSILLQKTSAGSTTDETVVASPSRSLPSHGRLGCHGTVVTSTSSTMKNSSLPKGENLDRHCDGLKLGTRYWSEYDNPGDLSGNEDGEDAYVIYLDPDAPSFLDFSIGAWMRKLYDRLHRSMFKRSTLEVSSAEERETLLDDPCDLFSASSPDEVTGLDGISGLDNDALNGRPQSQGHHVHLLHPNGTSQPIATLLNHLSSTHQARIRFKLFLSLACLIASLMVSTTSLVLAVSGKKKLKSRVDAAVLVCVVVSSAFSISGLFYGLSYLMDLLRIGSGSSIPLDNSRSLGNGNGSWSRLLGSRSSSFTSSLLEIDVGEERGIDINPSRRRSLSNNVFDVSSYNRDPVSKMGIAWRAGLLATLTGLTLLLNGLCIHWAIAANILHFGSGNLQFRDSL